MTKGVGLKLDVSDDGSEGLFVHVNLVEKKRWAGAVKGFMGNDADAKIGIGGGLVCQLRGFDISHFLLFT